MENLDDLPQLLVDLYSVVDRLQELAPGRPFTPDGHLVGSIGEVVAAYAYGLKLEPPSTKGFDARSPSGLEIQIKLTQGRVVAISSKSAHLLVLQLDRKLGFCEVYNGPGLPVWEQIASKAPEGRQRLISVAQLRALRPDPSLALPRVRDFPAAFPAVVRQAGVEFTNGDAPGVRLKAPYG